MADALREAFTLGALTKADLLADDAHLIACLHSSRSPLVEGKLRRLSGFRPEMLEGFGPRVIPKTRWLDPPVVHGRGYLRLSEIDG